VWNASDEALLAGYATGDPDAAAVFVRRFQSRVVGLALLITRDLADAEEVAQDAFVRAWRYAASYDPRRGSVGGWLMGITRNVALDQVRVVDRRTLRIASEAGFDALIEAADPADAATDVGDVAGRHDELARVAASLRALPAEQRQALVSVTLLGLSAREYAEGADVPLGTAKTRIRLALRKLREHLGVAAG
jgi:RNA polymerase sigma factor (sigma-70 family)